MKGTSCRGLREEAYSTTHTEISNKDVSGYILHNKMHTAHFTLQIGRCTLPNCTLQTADCTLHTTHWLLHTAHYTLITAHCTLHTADFTLHTPHMWKGASGIYYLKPLSEFYGTGQLNRLVLHSTVFHSAVYWDIIFTLKSSLNNFVLIASVHQLQYNIQHYTKVSMVEMHYASLHR